jgi:hypothetical protein
VGLTPLSEEHLESASSAPPRRMWCPGRRSRRVRRRPVRQELTGVGDRSRPGLRRRLRRWARPSCMSARRQLHGLLLPGAAGARPALIVAARTTKSGLSTNRGLGSGGRCRSQRLADGGELAAVVSASDPALDADTAPAELRQEQLRSGGRADLLVREDGHVMSAPTSLTAGVGPSAWHEATKCKSSRDEYGTVQRVVRRSDRRRVVVPVTAGAVSRESIGPRHCGEGRQRSRRRLSEHGPQRRRLLGGSADCQ